MAEELIRTHDRYFTKAQLWSILKDYIMSNTTTVGGAIKDAGEKKALELLCSTIAGEIWNQVSSYFSAFMDLITFRKKYYDSQNIRDVVEAFEQIDANGGIGAVRFRTKVYRRTNGHERSVRFENSILYGRNF